MAYMKLFYDIEDAVVEMEDADAGRLLKAALAYGRRGEQMELTGVARVIFPLLRNQIDRDGDAYDEKCEKLSENGKKGGRPKNQDGFEKTNRFIEKPIGFEKSQDKDKDKDKDKEKDKDKDEDPFVPDPVAIYVTNNLSAMTYGNFEDLRAFREDFPDDVITHAVDVAVGNGVRTWSYVRAILSRYIRDGVKTLGDVKAQEEKREQKKQDTAKTGAYDENRYPGLKFQHGGIDLTVIERDARKFFEDDDDDDGKEQNA